MTDDKPFYAPDNKGADLGPRASQPGEVLWRMTKHGHTCHAELRPVPGTARVELQIFADGEFRLAHLHANRDWAIVEAMLKQETLRVKGWVEAGGGEATETDAMNQTRCLECNTEMEYIREVTASEAEHEVRTDRGTINLPLASALWRCDVHGVRRVFISGSQRPVAGGPQAAG